MQKTSWKSSCSDGGGTRIGRVIALLFAKKGAKVVVTGRTQGAGEDSVRKIRKAGGEGVT